MALSYRYVDIELERISQADPEKKVGARVTIVPQTFQGRDYVGGFDALTAFLDKAGKIVRNESDNCDLRLA